MTSRNHGACVGGSSGTGLAQLLATVGMVPLCLFNVLCQNDAHGHCEQFHQMFPRARVDRL
jgi:hypothetical protein